MASDDTEIEKGSTIQIHFNIHEPIEMVEMTLAFQSIAHEYQTFLRERYRSQERKKLDDVKLYITRIESNCILAELVPAISMMGKLSAFAGHATDVVDFLKMLAEGIRFMRGLDKRNRVEAKDVPYGKRQVNNFQNLTRMVAESKGSDLGLRAIQYVETRGKVQFSAEFNSDECREAQRGAERALRAFDASEEADYPGVLMYFQQTNRDDPKAGGRTGDRAIIGTISDRPKRVHFLSTVDHDRIRHLLNDRGRNPLHTPMLVDASVERSPSGKPMLYRIIRLIDILDDDEEDEAEQGTTGKLDL